jgi:hypothetical protein
MPLYRYFTVEGAIATLKTGSLKLTPPREFNDPFDMNPGWRVNLSEDDIRKGYHALGFDDKMTFEEFCECVEPESRQLQTAAMKSFAFHLNQKLGAVCFSKLYDSVPMWAYYGSCHTGVVLEFDEMSHDFRQQFEGKLDKVHYEKLRPQFETLQVDDKAMLYVKGKEWEHEDEYRIIYPLDGLGVTPTKINDCQAWLLSFPKSALTRVIIGCRCKRPYQALICHSLSEWGYPNAEVHRLEPDELEFKLRLSRATCS